MQVAVVKRLLWESQMGMSGEYVVSDELIRHLQTLGFKELKERRQLSEKVIGKLRDANVIIASRGSSNGGYRLPTSVADLMHYLDHDAKLILPMLDRLRRAKQTIGLYSGGTSPFLEKQPRLKALVECYEKLGVTP
jgi:hypothetical protein